MSILRGQVLLLNSPPDSGKDYAASKIRELTGAKHCEFKATLHNIAMSITGLDKESYFTIYNDRDKKEFPQPEFFGMSPRQMLIWISEEVCKPKFGEQFFGMPAANSLDLENGSVFSDSGFPEEVFPLAGMVGAENIWVVRFNRNGSTFNGDSRDYLQPEDCPVGVNFIDLKNDNTIEWFVENILYWVATDIEERESAV